MRTARELRVKGISHGLQGMASQFRIAPARHREPLRRGGRGMRIVDLGGHKALSIEHGERTASSRQRAASRAQKSEIRCPRPGVNLISDLRLLTSVIELAAVYV